MEKLLRFSEIIGKMKSVKRSGWISHVGIDEPESVADHSFRCAILAMCIGDLANADTEKLVRMLLLHDVQEAFTGDYNHYAKKEIGLHKVKSKQKNAIKEIFSLLPATLKAQFLSLWEEFESQTTFEAVLANDIDKIEMIIQALQYEEEGYDPCKFNAFWDEVRDKFETPITQDLFKLLVKKRTKKE